MQKYYRDLYKRSKKINYIKVPALSYITIEGTGGPGGEQFLEAIPLLYKMAYALRMSYKDQLFSEFKLFTVGPLEGIWTTSNKQQYHLGDDKAVLDFKLMIVQPDWFTKEMFEQLKASVITTMPAVAKVKYQIILEGDCVQIMHIGSYDQEQQTLEPVFKDLAVKKLKHLPWSHHEIYLSDARRTKSENLKTIIRYQVQELK